MSTLAFVLAILATPSDSDLVARRLLAIGAVLMAFLCVLKEVTT